MSDRKIAQAKNKIQWFYVVNGQIAKVFYNKNKAYKYLEAMIKRYTKKEA